MLLTEIWEICSINQKHETSRLEHTRTKKNVIIVDEMIGLLNHKGQKQTYRSIRHTSEKNRFNKV